MKVKEVIVVEGKDDLIKIKSALDCEIIITNGLSLEEKTLKRIEKVAKKRGIIVFTDPDFPGEKIRNEISKRVKNNIKHAFIPKELAIKGNDLGVENASKEAIIDALKMARFEVDSEKPEFSKADLIRNKLIGEEDSANLRDRLGTILGIGYGNGKQFLNRLNNYGVSRIEFDNAIKELKNELRGV